MNAQFATLSAKYSEQAFLYSLVDLRDVDPLLQTHVRKCIATLQEATSVWSELETQERVIKKYFDDAAAVGAVFGAAGSDGDNPLADAVGGALIFTLAAAAEQQEELENFQHHYQYQQERIDTMLQVDHKERQTLADQLSAKYKTPFLLAF